MPVDMDVEAPPSTKTGAEMSPQIRDWVDSYLATTDYVTESTAQSIREADFLADAIASCQAVYTADPALQELRAAVRDSAMSLTWYDNNDEATAAAHAAIQSPEVCFDDPVVREMAFGDAGYLLTAAQEQMAWDAWWERGRNDSKR